MSKQQLSLVASLALTALFAVPACSSDDDDGDGAGGSSGSGPSGLISGKLNGSGQESGGGSDGSGGAGGSVTGAGGEIPSAEGISCMVACTAIVTCANQACGTDFTTADAGCDSECAGAGNVAVGESCDELATFLGIDGGFQSACAAIEDTEDTPTGGGGSTDICCQGSTCALVTCQSDPTGSACQSCMADLQEACGQDLSGCSQCENDSSWVQDCPAIQQYANASGN